MKQSKCLTQVCLSGFVALCCAACHPEMPVTSSIQVDLESLRLPVNADLYGVTIEEINHAVDGGLYAEMIQNRSFEDGVPPLNCPYDAKRNLLTTPNGYQLPFLRPDSIPGWRRYSSFTGMATDQTATINDRNRRSLFVAVAADTLRGRGGVVATGYGGLSVRRGKQYDCSFYVKAGAPVARRLHIYLQDSTGTRISDNYTVVPGGEWAKYRHTFTASVDDDRAGLVLVSDSSQSFWLDVVSLMPRDTWNERANGQRADLVKAIADLKPRFIRFPGGDFVEGYTAGTYPVWSETIGPIETRRHFWNVWNYGTTNGMGFHEYLQLCEDLAAEPVYVVNAGVTSQQRRPRYEDITAMDKLVQQTLDAIAYANEPADSTWGAMRAAYGHATPFHLKYIEIGSENYGTEYTKRFRLFEDAIHQKYPDITVISNRTVSKRKRTDWSDMHLNAGQSFYLSNTQRYLPTLDLRRAGAVFVGAFGYLGHSAGGTMQAAISEAVFLSGVENNPEAIRRLAYAPLLGNVHYTENYVPAISFDNARIALSPSYYMYKLFSENRGDWVLKSEVKTYEKPAVTFGRAGVYMFDNSYELEDVRMNGQLVDQAQVCSGDWTVSQGKLEAVPNRWNYLLWGDTLAYDYTLTARIRRTKGSGALEWRFRDNGLPDVNQDYLAFVVGRNNQCELYHQSGNVRDTLSSEKPFAIENNRWYSVQITCREERVQCSVDGQPVFDASMRKIPSLAMVATLDTLENEVILKVINTTWHEEITDLEMLGGTFRNDISVIEMAASPDVRNTLDNPTKVVPVVKSYSFPMGGPKIYHFPPHSVSILRLKLED